MNILGIETSCDETACAIVKDGTQLISNVVASSQAMHAKFGGIIPEKAAREQIKSIIPVISEAIQADRNTGIQEIDAIAVTVGPGLIGSLLVGVETAKTLSYAWNKPLIPVNHLIGHIYGNWLASSESVVQSSEQKDRQSRLLRTTNYELPTFPALVLLVSGGHSELILMTDHGKYKYLGGTRDDAAGECFDKCARLLNLGYPGGPAISAAAEKFRVQSSEFRVKLPRPMLNDKSFDFSFSGLKTAVANIYRSTTNSELPTPDSVAYELQEAITDVLVTKTRRAAEQYKVKTILLAGGVAANKRLREKIPEALCPPFELCTDNAAYIASAAFFNPKVVPWSKVNADPSLTI